MYLILKIKMYKGSRLESINIMQWNTKSIRSKVLELSRNYNNVDFILVSETWLKPPNNLFLVKGFDTVRRDR